ncbi:hypothetical protein [Taibaiella lutea]|nr:hypothetical protein [Taibaiella lutea]
MTGPVTWWAWGKRGYVECVSCGALSDIHPSSKEFAEARRIYSAKRKPLYYYVPSIVFGGFSLLVTLAIIIGIAYNVATTNKQKLQGIWTSDDGRESLFFFKDNQYTLLESDTIIFGSYRVDNKSDELTIIINGERNIINRININNLPLDVDAYGSVTFKKALSLGEGDNPYEKKFNHWRIKANRAESKSEVKDRVIAYLKYLQLRYNWAITNDLTYLPPEVYSPVLQAQNGIGVYEASLPLWKPIFYTDENYVTASKFLYYSFPKGRHINADEKNVFKRNLKAIDAYVESAKRTNIDPY